MADIQSPTTEIRRGKKIDRRKIERNHRAKILWHYALLHWAAIRKKEETNHRAKYNIHICKVGRP